MLLKRWFLCLTFPNPPSPPPPPYLGIAQSGQINHELCSSLYLDFF